MCGIAGVFLDRSTDKTIATMTRALIHRGPDDEGIECISVPGGVLGLGHRRLSILDLSAAGHQPMSDPATGNWVIFNGEIYNYPQLRAELAAAGACFRSQCDTEVILHAYVQWGTGCFERMHGMFAIGLYDRNQQRLILARDPLGIKPLYLAQSSSGLAFASELRALVASGMVERSIDQRALASLLAYGAVQQPLTMYQGVRLLEPGTWMAIDMGQPARGLAASKPQRYWQFPAPQSGGDYRDACERLHDSLSEAVGSHLMSDVPLGVFLSSGLDSSILATLSAAASWTPIRTFTVGFAEHQAIDEGPIAAETARLLGVEHHPVLLGEAEVLEQTERYLGALDQPTLDGLNTYIIAGAVRAQGIKVALSGLGGDELFGGYPSFSQVPSLVRWLSRAGLVPPRLRRGIMGVAFLRRSRVQRQKALELATTLPTVCKIYFRRRRLFSDYELGAFGLFQDDLNLDDAYLPPESTPDLQLVDLESQAAISVLESRFYMGNMLLRDADVFGMAHGLEIRVPLLDRNLIDQAYALPGAWRMPRNGKNKPLLADAMVGRLNPQLQGLPKRGFSLPQAAWMAGPLRPRFEHLLDRVADSGLVAPAAVHALWQDFLADQTGPTWSRAWTLGVLGAWLDANG
ncbi:MAG: asparagine synthase (glutamine-hydrolyzing) [Chromatiaceae bacterium]|nr:asparagine synthase (glutamine-hydrolyzing) [Chromatiaceae bacterium]MCF8002793.1 asparagine synthase (glutamine-hydrolyzing) [Chromatiaceae bacterium]